MQDQNDNSWPQTKSLNEIEKLSQATLIFNYK